MRLIKKILAYSLFVFSVLLLSLFILLNLWQTFSKRTTSIIYEGYKFTVTDLDHILLDTVKVYLPENSFIMDSSEESEEPWPSAIFVTDRFNFIVVEIVKEWNNEFTEEYYKKFPFKSIYRDILPIHTIYSYKEDNIYISYDGGDNTLNVAGVSFLADVYIPNKNIAITIIGDEFDFNDIKEYVAKVIYNSGSSEFKINREKIWQLKN